MIPQDIEELRKINPYAADEAEKEAARHGSNDDREQGGTRIWVGTCWLPDRMPGLWPVSSVGDDLMNFAQRMRLIWIDSQLECGPLNRSDIMQAFEISTAQAALDLKAYRTEHPSRIKYEPRDKHYRRPPKAKPAYQENLRFHVCEAIMAMQLHKEKGHD